MALENSPADARGLMSGILQQGYSFGYVCAACANLGVGAAVDSWKTVFWIAAGISIAVGIVRCFFPESPQFIEARKAGKNQANPSAFWTETKMMLAQEWKLCIYCVILMTWFNCELQAPALSKPLQPMLTVHVPSLQPYLPGLVHDLHAYPEGTQ